jgi:fructose-1,6-bisphosphatase II
MEKLACGPEVEDELDLNAPIEETLETVARAKRVRPRDLMVVILDRPRHDEMVKRIRAVGTRIRFIPHGDVSGALMAASPDTGIDLLWGIGGTPEGVLSAAAFSARGPVPGQAGPRDTPSAGPRSKPATTSTGCCCWTTLSGVTTPSSRPPA